MDNSTYDTLCLISSFSALIILILNITQINLCFFLIISALFSFIWRTYKLLFKINTYNNYLFYADFFFAIIAIICFCYNNKIDLIFKVLIITFLIFSWIFYFFNNKVSNTIHTIAHYVAIFSLIYCCYLKIK